MSTPTLPSNVIPTKSKKKEKSKNKGMCKDNEREKRRREKSREINASIDLQLNECRGICKQIDTLVKKGDENEIAMTWKQNERTWSRHVEALKLMERVKRNELERVSKKHEVSIDCIVGIFFRAGDEIHSLRRNQRTLSGFAAILAKEGRKRNEMAERLLNIVKSVEDERLVLINESGVAVEGAAVKWEDKRDFHLISFDHFRGTAKQTHLVEIAEVLRKRI